MNKILVGIVATLLLSGATAGTFIDYACSSPDLPYINSMNIHGEIELFTPDGKFEDNPIQIFTRDAGHRVEPEYLDGLISGKVYHHRPGRLAETEVFQIQSTKTIGKIRSVSLLIGHPGPLSSHITLSDGRTYKGRCNFKTNSF